MAKPSRRIACLACGSRRSEVAGVARNRDPLKETLFPSISISVCRDCGAIFQNPCLSRTQMNQVYGTLEDKVTPAGAGTVTAAESAGRLKALLRLAPPPARLLEVGSSDGTFLALARDAGYTVVGIDPSRANCAKARARFPGLDVREAFLESFRTDERFDVVCHFYVLEYSFHPRRFLASARALLRPDGLTFFEVPDVATFPRLPFANNVFSHQDISIFSRPALDALMRACSFAPLKERLGPATKSYGLRAAARPSRKGALGRNLRSHSLRLLGRYFGQRDALRREVARRVGGWLEDIGRREGPIVVFGAGENGRIVGEAADLRGRTLVFCDNNKALQGRVVDGFRVVSPAEVPALKPALAIAASIDYQADMVRQLASLGVPRRRIVELYKGF